MDKLKQQGIWHPTDSSKNDSSTSLGNVGGENLPGNLNSLGADRPGNNMAQFEWHLFQTGDVNYSDSGNWGKLSASGSTDFLQVQGRAYENTGFNDWTASASVGVQGRADLVHSHYQGEYDSPSLYNLGGHDIDSQTKLSADAEAGVSGFAEAGIGVGKSDYVDLGAGGFDGASATLKGSEDLGDFGGVNGDVTGWTGVGAKVDVDAGYKNGKFSFNFGAGLALGLGADYDWGFTIDFGNIADSLYNVAADGIDGVADAGKWVAGAASDAAGWVGDAAQTVGDTAEGVVSDVGSAAGDVVSDVGSAASNVASDVGGAISDAWDSIF
ncbi:MAG: hypothetical protein JO323_02625 [Acidobacteriia bacterium]|nr:hypothetical protein [Terriglobia bacterium]